MVTAVLVVNGVSGGGGKPMYTVYAHACRRRIAKIAPVPGHSEGNRLY